jgi:membrane protein DedA with SNARE-associated domain
MSYWRFFAFNASGGIVWSGIYTLGFYYAGSSLQGVRGPVDIGLGVAAAVFVIAFVIWLRRNERRLEGRAEERYPGPLADHLGPS